MAGALASCGGEAARPEASEPAAEVGSTADKPVVETNRKVVLFLGDSLSAGYGLDSAQAFPALIQKKIDEAGWNYEVVNAGVSGDTTAGGLRRLDWLLRRPVDVLFLELGGNDGLRGIDLDSSEANLQAIIDRVREKNPQVAVVVAGMMIPPNMGPEYTTRFRTMFPELAERNGATLIPFLLDGVAGRPDLNLPDGIHPTPEGHRIVADLVWETLRPVLMERRSQGS